MELVGKDLSYTLIICNDAAFFRLCTLRIFIIENLCFNKGFPSGSDGKESSCNAGDLGLIPGLGKSPGEGNGNPLQYSCLENPMDRGASRATLHRVAKVRKD